MNFIHPYWLWLIPAAILGLVFLGFRAAARRRRALEAWLGPDAGVRRRQTDLSPARRAWRRCFWLAGIACLAVAAARPWWEYSLVNAEERGRDVLVLFDVSKSMNAADVAPSRLAHAKWLLDAVVRSHPGDRFGLVPFAGMAVLACPLTSDAGALGQYIGELETDAVPLGGTNLGEALEVGLAALAEGASGDRGILLFTDGEELEGDAARQLQALKEKKIPLFIVGLGSADAGAPIPETAADGRTAFKRDAAGELIKTRLNEPLLRELAAAAGGVYVHSTALDSGLAAINRAIGNLTPEGRGERSDTVPIERFMPFLIAGMIFLALFWLLGERRRAAAAALVLALYLPADSVEWYNRALETEGPEAREWYEAAITGAVEQPEVRRRAYHNLGVIDHREARGLDAEARELLSRQQLQPALAKVKEADERLALAREAYRNAMGVPSDDPSVAQEALASSLVEQKQLRRLQEQIEELLEELEKLRQEARQAMDENQRNDGSEEQNPEQNDGQDSQGKKQSDGQNQPGQAGNDGEQAGSDGRSDGSRSDALERAADRAEELQRRAEELGQQSLGEQAAEAGMELNQARDRRDEGDRAGAGEHIERALDAIGRMGQQQEPGGEGQEQQQPQPDGGESEEQGAAAETQESAPDTPLPDSGGQKGEIPDYRQEERQIDPAQAEALLEMMAEDEQQVREAIRSWRQSRAPEAEKDW